MRRVIFIFLLSVFVLNTNAQSLYISKAKTTHLSYGIHKNMLIEVVVKSNLSPSDAVDVILNHITENEVIEGDMVLVDKNNSSAGFSYEKQMFQGLYNGRGAMRMRIVKPAVILQFNVNVSFRDNGEIVFRMSDFEEAPFFPIDKKGKYGSSNEEVFDDYKEMIALTSMTNSTMTKLILKANRLSSSQIDEGFEEVDKELEQQIEIIGSLIEEGRGEFIYNLYEAIDNFKSDVLIGGTSTFFKDRIEKEHLVVVDNERWDNYFLLGIIEDLIEAAESISGKIEYVSQDGAVLFNNVNGELKRASVKKSKK